MKRGDIMIAALLIVALAWFGYSALGGSRSHEEAAFASIYVNGEHYDTVALTEEEYEIEIRSERGYNRLKVSNYGIEMVESDCPDHICIGFGHVHSVNEKIVCLPNRVFVEIIGPDDEEGVDAFAS